MSKPGNRLTLQIHATYILGALVEMQGTHVAIVNTFIVTQKLAVFIFSFECLSHNVRLYFCVRPIYYSLCTDKRSFQKQERNIKFNLDTILLIFPIRICSVGTRIINLPPIQDNY